MTGAADIDAYLARIGARSALAPTLVTGRGGYCFEQNTLFRAVLERLGYQLAAFAARVRVGTSKSTLSGRAERSHQCAHQFVPYATQR